MAWLVYTHSQIHTHTGTKWLAHHVAINTATAILIFNCVDGLHLCCSVMQTLLYILSGLIVIRAENLIKLNNKGDRSFFFPLSRPFLPPHCILTPSMLQCCFCPDALVRVVGFITDKVSDWLSQCFSIWCFKYTLNTSGQCFKLNLENMS